MSILEPSISDYHIQLKPDHQEIQALAREFARKEIAPIADTIDKEDNIPKTIVD